MCFILFLGASRARALSTFMDISPIDCPKANSTFVVDKKCLEDLEECLSPQMFSPEIKTSKKPANPNETYNMPMKSSDKNESVENSNSVLNKVGSKEKRLLLSFYLYNSYLLILHVQ